MIESLVNAIVTTLVFTLCYWGVAKWVTDVAIDFPTLGIAGLLLAVILFIVRWLAVSSMKNK